MSMVGVILMSKWLQACFTLERVFTCVKLDMVRQSLLGIETFMALVTLKFLRIYSLGKSWRKRLLAIFFMNFEGNDGWQRFSAILAFECRLWNVSIFMALPCQTKSKALVTKLAFVNRNIVDGLFVGLYLAELVSQNGLSFCWCRVNFIFVNISHNHKHIDLENPSNLAIDICLGSGTNKHVCPITIGS